MKIQEYMEKATVQTDKEDEINNQVMGLIGIALIAVSEVVGTKMVIRNVHHILQYCSLEVKRAVPIMLAIIGVKEGSIQVQDLLYKLAHNEDKEMSFRALLALGIIGAGTNNSRIGGLLRSLAQYYENEDEHIYIIKIALGILHAGKGLIGLNPYYSEDFLYSKTSFAGLFILINAMTNVMEFLVKENHYLFYYLATAFYPKMLFLLDEDLNQVKINVRVGQAIDTVAQVGQPRKITGFQTHISPVIINNGERSEIGTEEYIPATNTILENFVIIKKNPDYVEEEPKNRKKTSAVL
jgi:26S proteasome regulatory subunit N1